MLARDVRATRDVPHFANSAVDGFAFAFRDLNPSGETRLAVCGEIATGEVAARPLARDKAMRVYTGSALPEGADTVAMEEDVRIEGESVDIPQGLKRGANRRLPGDDIRKNTLLLTKGRRLNAVDCAVLASLGVTQTEVLPRLRVALFSSGAELKREKKSEKEFLKAAQIFDSNAVLLRNWLHALGCEIVEGGILPDDSEGILRALDTTMRKRPADLLLSSGGMSQSRLDGMARLFKERRAFAFWRVAVKPGRPVGIGALRLPSVAAAVPFAGLPGNPVACFLTFGLLVQPLIFRLSGERRAPPRRFKARLGFDGKKKRGRREFVRTTLSAEEDIEKYWDDELRLPVLTKHGKSGAGVLSSLLDADGFAELDEKTTDYKAGDIVNFLPMREIFPR